MKAPLCLWVFFLAAAGVAFAADEAEVSARQGEVWERAALNREAAARAQRSEANAYFGEGQTLRVKEYLYQEERAENMYDAGEKEALAGARYASASVNLDKAAKNWEKAAAVYQSLGKEDRWERVLIKAREARAEAVAAGEQAALAYEYAAQAFDSVNSDNPQKAADASEKAATWHEKMAVRQAGE